MEPDEIAALSCDILLDPLINASDDSSRKGQLLKHWPLQLMPL